MKDQSSVTHERADISKEIASGGGETVPSDAAAVTISAWMDGDEQTSLPSELFTESGHATWQVYHLIGDTLRTPELALTSKADLSHRIAQALVTEPALAQVSKNSAEKPSVQSVQANPPPRQLTSLAKLMRRIVWPSVAMVAAVASVVWVAKPLFVPELSAPSVQASKTDATRAVASNLEASAVRDYVTAHRQISGPANVRPASFGVPR
jgi:sigma-E factor negative regulatory protein RseA